MYDQIPFDAVDEVFAGRLRVMPKDLQTDVDASVVQLRLDPGLAFGTGGHPTTRLCLKWLAEHVQQGQRVLDFGCGSGILAIAAALLGAQVVAVDHDPQAVMATRDNAAYNGVHAASLNVLTLEQWRQEPREQYFDVVVANILAGPLQELAAEFERALAGGGRLVLSGVLEAQADAVMSAYVQSDFDTPEVDGGWVCLHGTKRTR